MKVAMETVCVCIPTRNRVEFVKRALDSVLAQTVHDFRVLVSDDASEHSAAAEVESHLAALADPRIAYRYHSENLEEYDHGRFMFGQCCEKFFAILHDDDLWDPTFLRRCLDIFAQDPSLACVTTDQYIIEGNGTRNARMTEMYQKRMGRNRYPEGRLPILEPLLTHSLFALSCTLFSSDALTRSGLVDPGLHGNAIFDINLFLRLGECGEQAYYIPEPLAAYRVHDDRLTVKEERGGFNVRLLETLITLLEKRRFSGRPEKERRRQLAAAYHNYAILCYLRGEKAGLYRYLRKCVLTRPGRWKNWAYLTFALFPFLVKPVFGSRAAPTRRA